MSKAAPGPSGAAVGSGRPPSGSAVKPRQVNMKYLDGFSGEVENELRATEDEVVRASEQQAKRDGLYE